jgi:hypothetical protein
MASRLRGVAHYFFRIVEQGDGSWRYQRGRADLDWFGQLDDAIEHVTDIASDHTPSEVLVHRADGRVQSIATFDE